MSAAEPVPAPARVLTRDEVRQELQRVRPGANDALGSAIQGHAARSRSDPGELLAEAVVRALSTRAVPADVPFDALLGEIARSIASGINIGRARAREVVLDLPLEDVVAQLPAGGYSVSTPDELIEHERVRELCIVALEQIAGSDPLRHALIDGIGQGERGKALLHTLQLSERELATVRRALKREAQRIWPTISPDLTD